MIENNIDLISDKENDMDLNEKMRIKKVMNKLTQFEKSNNLYKMKSGVISI